MKRLQKKKRLGLFIGLVLAVIGLILTSIFIYFLTNKSSEKAEPDKQITAVVEKEATGLRIAMMGDMLAHDSVVNQAKNENLYDFTSYFKQIRPLYEGADIVFCNAETASAGEAMGISGYPVFNAPREFALGLVDGAMCNVINLATNHIADKGQAGIDATLAVWREQKKVLAVAGANSSAEDQQRVSYFKVKGVRVAFLAFADFSNVAPPNSYSLNLYHDSALVERLMKEAREQADFVIVSAHWGTEDVTTVNDEQRKTAQLFADYGAHLVIGTGPHVLQPYELVLSRPVDGTTGRTVPVWYSLGNMLSSQLQLNQLTGGIAYQVFEKDNELFQAQSTEFYPTFMSYDWPSADRASERLSTRSNLLLQPLKNAEPNIIKMFPQSSFDERMTFVKSTLGAEVTVR